MAFSLLCFGFQAQAMPQVSCRRGDFAQTKVSFLPEGNQVRIKFQSQYTNLISGISLPTYPGLDKAYISDLLEFEFLVPEKSCHFSGTPDAPLIRCHDYNPQGTIEIRSRILNFAGTALTADTVTTAYHFQIGIDREIRQGLSAEGVEYTSTNEKFDLSGQNAAGEISGNKHGASLSYSCQ